MRAGKDVVTPNKALLALHGKEVYAAARSAGRCVAFEASCAGGIPLIRALCHGLIANRIDTLCGIVNGTCNYILTEMLARGKTYREALEEAQQHGYAEADPTVDVDGTDSAHKLAILASLAFGADVDVHRIHVEGIDRLDLTDLRAGDELGYVCKLLAIGRREEGGLSLRVHPAFLRRDHPLGNVAGPFNAVSVYGDNVGHTLYYGRGAGAMPTASAIVADLVDVALGSAGRAFAQLPIFADRTTPPVYRPMEAIESRYYLRFMVYDRPGIMARLTRVFGDKQISLSAIVQHEAADDSADNVVPVVVMTHLAREGSVREALHEISRYHDVVTQEPVWIRVVEEHDEF